MESTPHQFTKSHLTGPFKTHDSGAGWYVIAKPNDPRRSDPWQAVEGPYSTKEQAQDRVRWYRKQARA